MKGIKGALFALTLLIPLLAACAAAPARDAAMREMPAEPFAVEMDYGEAIKQVEVEMVAEAPRAPAASYADVGVTERMIIRTVNMSLMVEDTDAALEELQRIVRERRGYVADMNRWLGAGDQPFANITVRVPAETLDAALEEMRGLAIKIDRETSSGQDVTEEYTDIQARLRNLEATETELLALLTEVRQTRSKAEDILAIHRELTAIREQIETLKGRSNYLERMAALATVHLEIRPREVPGTVVEPLTWNPLVTAANAGRYLIALLRVLVDVAIYALILSPILIVPLLVLWLLVRFFKARGRRKRQAEAG